MEFRNEMRFAFHSFILQFERGFCLVSKIYDSWDNVYKSNFGALKRGESCKFMVSLPKNIHHDLPPIMVVFRIGFKERFIAMNETGGNDEFTEYSADYAPSYVGIYYYYFTIVSGGSRSFIKKIGSHEGAICDGQLFQLTVYSENFTTPKTMKGGIIYQIFPDRFFKSGLTHKNIPEDRIIKENWCDIPEYKPDSDGHVWNNDYFGGDLRGIIDKLPYIKSLGVTCIYLNPIFEAHENHRYNTANYLEVDPLLGTIDDFRELCRGAKLLGITIILDGVFSHTGADSVYFNKFGRYRLDGAYQTKESPYYSWYTFINFPNEYEAWWGINTLPNVNENNDSYTNYICGKDGVIDFWIKQGASGFRLDVADELPDEFLDNLRKAVKRNGSEKIIIGEVWEDASNKESYGVRRRYLLGDQLDCTMNYPFRDAILGYIRGMNSHEFENQILTILENYPKPCIDTMMNSISTHDTERCINALAGENLAEKSKDWQSTHILTEDEYKFGKKRLKSAMVLQFFLPGIPSIYYGDEAGMQGDKDPFNRKCYPWGNVDEEIIGFVKELSKIRRRCDLFIDGRLKFLFSDGDLIAFSRFDNDQRRAVVIILNKGDQIRFIRQDNEIIRRYSDYDMVRGEMKDGVITLDPSEYAVFKVGL